MRKNRGDEWKSNVYSIESCRKRKGTNDWSLSIEPVQGEHTTMRSKFLTTFKTFGPKERGTKAGWPFSGKSGKPGKVGKSSRFFE